MKMEELDEVIDCIGGDRKVFYYFKDRYCLDMMLWEMKKIKKELLSISDLNQGRLKRFMSKPIVKEITQHCGDGFLEKDVILYHRPNEMLSFTLTMDRWGGGDRAYDQTSRNQQNLVLQINFDNKHNQQYRRLLNPSSDCGPFEYSCHPVRMDCRNTMSWVRIDLDLLAGEALIEEVQNDWLREAAWGLNRVTKRRANRNSTKPSDIIYGVDCDYASLKEYVDVVLKPYRNIWAEISLHAAINFIREDLGISTIYYHTFDTGRKIKKIYGSPPKSMYTRLPKQFGFELTNDAPEFIKKDKVSKRYLKAIKKSQWYCLAV